MSKLELKLTKSLWGVNLSVGWDTVLAKVKNDGFSAVETISICYDTPQDPGGSHFKEMLLKYGK